MSYDLTICDLSLKRKKYRLAKYRLAKREGQTHNLLYLLQLRAESSQARS
jgi:hypothetical protein